MSLPAVRGATMRALLADGADPEDLRALEDLVQHLSRVPDDAWEGTAGRREPGRAPAPSCSGPAWAQRDSRAPRAPSPSVSRAAAGREGSVDAADDDLVGLDRDLDLAVALPVLGVDRVGAHRRIEPEAVAILLAVVEGRLEPGARALRATSASPSPPAGRSLSPPPPPCAWRPPPSGFRASSEPSSESASSSESSSSSSSSLLVLLVLLGLHRGLDLGLDLVAQIDVVARALLAGEVVAADEIPQFGRRDIELVGDPSLGASLLDPGTNLVQL